MHKMKYVVSPLETVRPCLCCHAHLRTLQHSTHERGVISMSVKFESVTHQLGGGHSHSVYRTLLPSLRQRFACASRLHNPSHNIPLIILREVSATVELSLPNKPRHRNHPISVTHKLATPVPSFPQQVDGPYDAPILGRHAHVSVNRRDNPKRLLRQLRKLSPTACFTPQNCHTK